MRKPTPEQIEAVSRLLEACRLCGAKFKTGLKTEVTMPDTRTYHVDERITCWKFTHRGFSRTFKKSASAESLKDQILEFYNHVLTTTMKSPLKTNYEVQPDGDVWVRHNGILKIIPAGLDTEAFLASVEKRAPGEVNVTISKLFKGTVAA